jgi:hypothetical protein
MFTNALYRQQWLCTSTFKSLCHRRWRKRSNIIYPILMTFKFVNLLMQKFQMARIGKWFYLSHPVSIENNTFWSVLNCSSEYNDKKTATITTTKRNGCVSYARLTMIGIACWLSDLIKKFSCEFMSRLLAIDVNFRN